MIGLRVIAVRLLGRRFGIAPVALRQGAGSVGAVVLGFVAGVAVAGGGKLGGVLGSTMGRIWGMLADMVVCCCFSVGLCDWLAYFFRMEDALAIDKRYLLHTPDSHVTRHKIPLSTVYIESMAASDAAM